MEDNLKNKLRSIFTYDEDFYTICSIIGLIDLKNILLIGLTGSQAYGTNHERSDYDVRILYKQAKEQFFGIQPVIDGLFIVKSESEKKSLVNSKNVNPNNVFILNLDSIQKFRFYTKLCAFFSLSVNLIR